MVIMDADRFGVSQLHQLRGRVGRGSAPGLCLLVTEMPEASPARERLDAVAATLDGFELSRIDLEQRREGDVLGQAQSGVRSSLRVLAVIDDEEVIAAAREEATAVVDGRPGAERLPGAAHRAGRPAGRGAGAVPGQGLSRRRRGAPTRAGRHIVEAATRRTVRSLPDRTTAALQGPMTRVIAGAAGGRRLAVPPGNGTRPTSDRAREGLFSTWESLLGSLGGARVLDLYAGSGAVGLEALSRGAAHALLVEADAARRPHRSGRTSARWACPAPRSAPGKAEQIVRTGPGRRPVRRRLPRPAVRRHRRRSSRDPAHTPARRLARGRSARHRGAQHQRRRVRAGRTVSRHCGPVATARERFGTVAPPLRATDAR